MTQAAKLRPLQSMQHILSMTDTTSALPSKTSAGCLGESIGLDAGEYEGHCEKHGKFAGTFYTFNGKRRESPCPKCGDERQAEKAREEASRKASAIASIKGDLLRRSQIPLRFRDRTLENFRAESDGQRRALKIAKAYAASFDDRLAQGGGLVLCGKPGTGKTHLACAIAMHVAGQGRSAKFMTVIQAVREVKETYRRDSNRTEQEAIDAFEAPDLLILDEVGVQWGSDAEKLILFEIINGRYAEMRPTILISNLMETELGAYIGDRAVDRMREGGGAVIAFDWPSYRSMVAKDGGLEKRPAEPVDWDYMLRTPRNL